MSDLAGVQADYNANPRPSNVSNQILQSVILSIPPEACPHRHAESDQLEPKLREDEESLS